MRRSAAGSTGCRRSRRPTRCGRLRIRRHLDALHQEEASVLAVVTRPARAEARAAEDEARRRRELAGRRRLRRLDDVRSRRRGRAPELGHLPRAAAGDRRDEGRERARAGRGGDCRRPHPADRGLRAPRAGARRRRRRLARAEEPRQRGPRRARAEGRRAVGEDHVKLRLTKRRATCKRSNRLW